MLKVGQQKFFEISFVVRKYRPYCSVWPDGYIILKYLPIYNNENLPVKHNIFAKVGLKFGQIINKFWKICPRLLKFRQIWSHCCSFLPDLRGQTLSLSLSSLSLSLSLSLSVLYLRISLIAAYLSIYLVHCNLLVDISIVSIFVMSTYCILSYFQYEWPKIAPLGAG